MVRQRDQRRVDVTQQIAIVGHRPPGAHHLCCSLGPLGDNIRGRHHIQPILQHRIWDRLPEASGPKALARVIDKLTEEDDRFHMEGSLAQISYDDYDPDTLGESFAPALDKCPRESMVWVGKPSDKDLAAVADAELPERVEADFKTTVDKTEWRG